MEYATFLAQGRTWCLYSGVGTDGPLLGRLTDAFAVHDFSAACWPVLWLYSQDLHDGQTIVERLTLPALRRERITWNGGRIGALATGADGERAVALELPQDIRGKPQLWLWNGDSWSAVRSQVIPDISSRLAELGGGRVVCESVERRLCIIDVYGGKAEIGPSGSCPVAATDIREWYAISEGHVVRFAFEQPFNSCPAALDGLSFGDVTDLRVTHDGNVFTWREPRFLYRSRGYIQQRGQGRKRFQKIDYEIGGVVGPFDQL